MIVTKHLSDGKKAEKLAQGYLKKQGFHLLVQNFSCKVGEIDLIMRHDNLIVFVEVRYLSNTRFMLPEETITLSKQKKIIKTAHFFLSKYNNTHEFNYRFDIIAIQGKIANDNINWINDAFQT